MKSKCSMAICLAIFAVISLLIFTPKGETQSENQQEAREMSEASQNQSSVPKDLRATKRKRSISLLVEEGFVLPPQLLGRIKNTQDSKIDSLPGRPIVEEAIELPDSVKESSSAEVTFTIVGGTARFETQQGLIAIDTVADGVITIPPIIAGLADDESYINILVGGETILENLRVATLPVGNIEKLSKYISTGDAALISLSEHHAVIDENKWVITSDEAVTGYGKMGDRKMGGGKGSSQQLAGLCIRLPVGGGKVVWRGMPNPRANGFSYLPENGGPLRWGTAPDDKIDAIYRSSWGCGVAIKVPNSCTVDMHTDNSYNWCCNLAAQLAGHKVQVVNPRDHGFPNCPLR